MSSDFKPCPFCGGEAELKRKQLTELGKEIVFIECQECGATSAMHTFRLGVVPPRASVSNPIFAPVKYEWNRRITE